MVLSFFPTSAKKWLLMSLCSDFGFKLVWTFFFKLSVNWKTRHNTAAIFYLHNTQQQLNCSIYSIHVCSVNKTKEWRKLWMDGGGCASDSCFNELLSNEKHSNWRSGSGGKRYSSLCPRQAAAAICICICNTLYFPTGLNSLTHTLLKPFSNPQLYVVINISFSYKLLICMAPVCFHLPPRWR